MKTTADAVVFSLAGACKTSWKRSGRVRCTLRLERMEVGMSQKTFLLVAGVFFLLIALAHLFRIAFGASVVVQNTSIPMWASWIAAVVMGYLAYEGIRLGRKSLHI
jgi:hypothetical protein